MSRNGLLIDYEYCSGCHSCEVACKQDKGFPPGKWGIKLTEIGPWQHSEKKWEWSYIPVPTDLCDLCEERVGKGEKPTCVFHCLANVMEFGPVDELAEKMKAKSHMVLFAPK